MITQTKSCQQSRNVSINKLKFVALYCQVPKTNTTSAAGESAAVCPDGDADQLPLHLPGAESAGVSGGPGGDGLPRRQQDRR